MFQHSPAQDRFRRSPSRKRFFQRAPPPPLYPQLVSRESDSTLFTFSSFHSEGLFLHEGCVYRRGPRPIRRFPPDASCYSRRLVSPHLKGQRRERRESLSRRHRGWEARRRALAASEWLVRRGFGRPACGDPSASTPARIFSLRDKLPRVQLARTLSLVFRQKSG